MTEVLGSSGTGAKISVDGASNILLVRGTDRDISQIRDLARDLDVAEPTVKLHVKTLYRKLGVANRTQAAILARESGLF